jgi:Kiwa protein KwaB-like
MARKVDAVQKQMDLFEQMVKANWDDCTATVCLGSISNKAEEPQIEQLQISDDLTKEFRNAAREMARKYSKLLDKADLAFRLYDAGSKPDGHEVEFLNLEEHGQIKTQVESLSALAQIPAFKVEEGFVAGLRFYVIILQCKDGEPLFLFRTYTPKKELSRSAWFGAIFEEGTFDRIDEPVFLFDHGIDCMCRDGVMYIFNKHNFQKIFRFFELVLKAAEETLKTIKALVPIANFDEFKQACEGHLQMQAKLKNIACKPYLKNVKMSDIRRALKDFPDLGVKIVKRNGKEMLLFDSEDKWAVLRLLDDDYLGSVLTGEKYEVTGKRPYQA